MVERPVDLSTSGQLFTPGKSGYFAAKLNKEDGRSQENMLGLEIYASTHSFVKAKHIPLLGKFSYFRNNPVVFEDAVVSVERIKGWMSEYGPFAVERIHGAFHSDIPNALKNFLWNSFVPLAKPYEPCKASDRWLIAVPVSWITMTAQNNHATKLAGEFGAGLNFHRNVVERAVKTGRMKKIRGNAGYIWIENDLDYIRERPDQFRREVSIVSAIEAIKMSGADGLILGIDHAFRANKDPRDYFEEHADLLKENLRCIHICGSKGDHSPLLPDDKEVVELCRWLGPRLDPRVRFCVDTNPFLEAGYTEDQQYDGYKGAVHMLQSV